MSDATPRGPMTDARKRRIWTHYAGECACGAPVPIKGPGVTYDHDVQLWMKGPESDENVRPLCDPCNALKTSNDAKARAKVRKLWKKAAFAPRAPSKLKGKGFVKAKRGFPKKPKAAKIGAAPPPSVASRVSVQIGPTRYAPGALLKGALKASAGEQAAKGIYRRRK